MKVYVEKQDKLLELEKKSVKELLDELQINSNTVIIVKNNEIVLEDEQLDDNDDIKILSVISGGWWNALNAMKKQYIKDSDRISARIIS